MASREPDRDTVVTTVHEIKSLLKQLHLKHAEQETSLSRRFYELRYLFFIITHWNSKESWDGYHDKHCSSQYLSHSKEKLELIYMLARMNGSTSILECGTSFGLSTIYLALAVGQNVSSTLTNAYGVLTMEKDSRKMAQARENWAQAGTFVSEWIHPKEGNLLEILADETNLPETVDLLFLDAWMSIALPALKLVLTRLRRGSIVVADKTISGRLLYKDLLDFVRDPLNGFMSVTIPFPQGLEVMVYSPST